MSLELAARPRRGRPPARNEIVRASRLGGFAPDELADRFGTPLYVYDFDVIEHQVTTLQAGRDRDRQTGTPAAQVAVLAHRV